MDDENDAELEAALEKRRWLEQKKKEGEEARRRRRSLAIEDASSCANSPGRKPSMTVSDEDMAALMAIAGRRYETNLVRLQRRRQDVLNDTNRVAASGDHAGGLNFWLQIGLG